MYTNFDIIFKQYKENNTSKIYIANPAQQCNFDKERKQVEKNTVLKSADKRNW